MAESFVALDVETANADLQSICQIGVALFENGEPATEWSSLINPEDYFDPIYVSIHGIDEATVTDAPRFPDIYDHLQSFVDGRIVAIHTPFDKVAVHRACERYGVRGFGCTWLDTARVCRRAWRQEFARAGYGLANVARWCGIDFSHHDALEDARAAGLILLRAIEETGLSVSEWIVRAYQPIDPSGATRTGDPDGAFFGQTIVFTGALSMTRREAADLAAAIGCDVGRSVTKKTTILVVGQQDLRKLAGHRKSAKHRHAEKLIAKGHELRIIGERDFLTLVE